MPTLEQRLPIWEAISEFYLDTELDNSDYDAIYNTLKESGQSLDSLKEIDLFEVFPTLCWNLFATAGAWSGFDTQWLAKKCSKNYIRKKIVPFRIVARFLNLLFFWMRIGHWKQIEKRFKINEKRATTTCIIHSCFPTSKNIYYF